MQNSRLFEIVYLLLNRQKMTAKELAERFEVSTRTIYRDVDALSAAGIPVYTVQGTGGGIYLQENFVLNKSLLSGEEQEKILFALQSLAATSFLEAGQILDRLGGLFQKEADWIEVDFSRWGDDEADKQKFKVISGAILGRQVLQFDYTGVDSGFTTRTVSPIKLFFKSKAWYLQAYCHARADYRLFKLTRMSAVVLGDFFDKDALPPPSSMSAPDAAPPSICVDVTIRFSPAAAYRLPDEFDPRTIVQNGDGSSTVTANLPCDNWLCGYILSFGSHAEVVSPPCIRERLLKISTDIANLYR